MEDYRRTSEERGVVDQQHVAARLLRLRSLPVLPVLERQRQEMRDIDDFGCLALDDS